MIRFSKFVLAAGVILGTIGTTQTLTATVAAAEDMYGAIATSENSDWGYGYNYPTQAQAEAEALKQCGKGECVVRVWFKNACGAVAENNNTIGWGWGESEAEAKAQAVSGCGTGDCKVLTWACTDR
jgi:Domain of unknown function (DUF4189)